MTDYRGTAPYSNFKNHKIKYAKGYKEAIQKTVGMKPDHWNKAVRSAEKSRSYRRLPPGATVKAQGNHKNSEERQEEINELFLLFPWIKG